MWCALVRARACARRAREATHLSLGGLWSLCVGNELPYGLRAYKYGHTCSVWALAAHTSSPAHPTQHTRRRATHIAWCFAQIEKETQRDHREQSEHPLSLSIIDSTRACVDKIRSHKYVSTIKTMLLLGLKYLLLRRAVTGSILKHSTGSLETQGRAAVVASRGERR